MACWWHSTPSTSLTGPTMNCSVHLFAFHSPPPWNVNPLQTAAVPASRASCPFLQPRGHARPYLAKAALPKHHEEVKIGQLHPVSVPIVVRFGYGVGCLFLRSLRPLTDLGSLEGGSTEASLALVRRHMNSCKLWLLQRTPRPHPGEQHGQPLLSRPKPGRHPRHLRFSWLPHVSPTTRMSFLPPSGFRNSSISTDTTWHPLSPDNPPWFPPHWASHAARVSFSFLPPTSHCMLQMLQG